MAKDLRIIIAGGRDFTDYDKMKNALDSWKKTKKLSAYNSVTEVCGCAEGADDLGRRYAKENGWNVSEFPANWELLGKPAGILRNRDMAAFAQPSNGIEGYLLAFWNGKSRGTKNMVETAIQYGLKIVIFATTDEAFDIVFNEYLEAFYKPLTEIITDPNEAMVDIPKKLDIVVKRI